MIIPIGGWDKVAERALRFGLRLSDDITAVHVTTEQDDPKRLRELWAENVEKPARAAHSAVPRLEILPPSFSVASWSWLSLASQESRKRTKEDTLLPSYIGNRHR